MSENRERIPPAEVYESCQVFLLAADEWLRSIHGRKKLGSGDVAPDIAEAALDGEMKWAAMTILRAVAEWSLNEGVTFGGMEFTDDPLPMAFSELAGTGHDLSAFAFPERPNIATPDRLQFLAVLIKDVASVQDFAAMFQTGVFADSVEKLKKAKRRKLDRDGLEVQGIQILQQYKGDISAKDFAKKLGVAVGVAVKLRCWMAVQSHKREMNPPIPKTISLPKSDETLAELEAEQSADRKNNRVRTNSRKT